MRREHIVNQIREIVHRVAPTAQTILYGSEARGDWFFLIMTNLPMMKKMKSDGLCMSWKSRQVYLSILT